jgi:glycosyltransferase involved in cell wall biosynthesis
VVTPLDVRALAGSSEGHRAEQHARAGADVTVIHKIWNRSRRAGDLARDAFTLRVSEEREGGVRRIAVDPPLNHAAGLRTDAEESVAAGARPSLALRLLRLASPLGILRELLFVTAALRAARRVPGPIDACIGVGPWGALVALRLRARGRAAVAVYLDRDLESGLVRDATRRRIIAWAERYALRRADVAVSVGARLAAKRERETGRRPHVVPNGVDAAAYFGCPPRAPGGARLVYVGNVIRWSGLELVVQALPDLAVKHAGVELRVVGDGLPGFLDRLAALAEQLGVSERVHFLGRRPPQELPALLAEADVALAIAEPVPFRRYAVPLKLGEYFAAGLPVVVTTDTEAADLVARAGAGIAVPYAVAPLCAALAELLADPARRAELGANAAAAARALDWSALAAQEREHVVAALARSSA